MRSTNSLIKLCITNPALTSLSWSPGANLQKRESSRLICVEQQEGLLPTLLSYRLFQDVKTNKQQQKPHLYICLFIYSSDYSWQKVPRSKQGRNKGTSCHTTLSLARGMQPPKISRRVLIDRAAWERGLAPASYPAFIKKQRIFCYRIFFFSLVYRKGNYLL